MNLETAKKIIVEELIKVCGEDCESLEGGEVRDWCNGGNFYEDLGYNHRSSVVTLAAQEGAEGDGAMMSYVFKIEHPDYPVAYICWSGTYSSWGCNQWYSEPEMVEPKEVVVIQYHAVK